MKLFWINPYLNSEHSIDDFVFDITSSGTNNTLVFEKDPYMVFVKIIRNILNKKTSILIDSDISEKELSELSIETSTLEEGLYHQGDLRTEFQNLEEIRNFMNINAENIYIEIFTSGTTGRPKKITQSLSNIIRFVKRDENMSDDIWAFAYNETHFAGLQVFFQAFYNENEIVYVFGKDFELNYEAILKQNVTNLSCTPTYMKMLIPYVESPNSNLKRLSFGGEKLDEKLLLRIEQTFPNAKIKNIYASSEAGSLLASNDIGFSIPKRFENDIKISENNELMINKSLMGISDTLVLENGWYKTGDIVEWIDNKTFSFKNRKSDFINVGGYKVNPQEVEDLIKSVEGVYDVSIKGRKNSILGNVLVAYIILEKDIDQPIIKKKIEGNLLQNLQDWKIPRIYKFVEEFDLTRTGKIKKT